MAQISHQDYCISTLIDYTCPISHHVALAVKLGVYEGIILETKQAVALSEGQFYTDIQSPQKLFELICLIGVVGNIS